MLGPPSTAPDAASILAAAPEAYACLDCEFRYTFVNPATEQLLGKRSADLLGKALWEVYPELRGTRFESCYRRTMAERLPVTFEAYYEPWRRWYAISAMPDAGNGIIVRTVDITERKRMEDALRAGEAKFRDLFDGAPVAYHELDRDGVIRRVNRAECALLGYEPAELLGRPIWEFIVEADQESSRAAVRRKLSGEQPLEPFERRFVRRDGGALWLEIRDALVRNAAGETTGVRSALFDISERKRVEESLDRQNSVLNSLFESLPLGVCMVEAPSGKPVFANGAALELLGGGALPEAGKGNPAAGFRFIERPGGLPYPMEEMPIVLGMRGKRSHVDDMVVVRPDGAETMLEVFGSPVTDGQGNVWASLATYADITERKQAEEKLRQSEAKFAAAQRIAQVGSWQWDIRTDTASWSDETFRIFGVDPNELGDHRRNFVDMVHPDDRMLVDQALSDAIDGNAAYDIEYRIKRPDGSERAIWAQAEVERDQEGTPAIMRGTVRDVTERKRAERRLRESESRLREAEQLAHVGSSSWDADSDVTEWSEELYRIAGRDPGSPAPGHLDRASLYSPESWARLNEAVKRALATGEPYDLELDLARPDGSLRQAHARGAATRDERGRIVRLFGSLQDITERKRAEAERAKLQAQLWQSQKMESVGRLAGGVAHDFNNLLTVINGYSKMLLAELRPDDPMRDSLAEIHRAGERAAGLTRQLLAFSRKQVLEPRRLDINRLVQDMRPMLARLLREDIEVRIALHAERGTVLADPHQLEQVVMNLVVNARDAMPGAGELLVETSNVERDESYARSHPEARAGRYVALAVTDTGEGMDEETKDRIFEPFFTTKGIGKGTGLGLSIAQGIVAQSGGYVEVYSEKGRGTTFKIYLPASTDEEAADAEDPDAAPAWEGHETVLVVEDQEDVRKYVVAALKGYGYRTIPAQSAAEALLACQRERIDLVLTDMVMPQVSGRELADQLSAFLPGVKVLFMSGHSDTATAEHEAMEEGGMFIQKPFGPEELAARVRAALGPALPASTGRILVADDEAAARGLLRKALESNGYEVIEAADGRQALRQALAGRVDVVITDLVMPELEGIETIQALRRELPGVGIIAVSGAFGGQLLGAAQMLGADAVLCKPVNPESLLAKVAKVLKGRR